MLKNFDNRDFIVISIDPGSKLSEKKNIRLKNFRVLTRSVLYINSLLNWIKIYGLNMIFFLG
jgi:hypothetical protein